MTAESSALKSVCLDHLATIGAKLFNRKVQVAQTRPLPSLPNIVGENYEHSAVVADFKELCQAHHDYIGMLSGSSDEDGAYEVRNSLHFYRSTH